MKSQQLISTTTTKLLPGPSAKNKKKQSCNISKEITSFLILTAAQKQQVLDDPTWLTKHVVPDHVENYKQNQQLLIDLCAKLEESQKDNSDYAS
jgi:hypothetical protein